MREKELSTPTIADYIVVQDALVTLPKSNGDIDHDYPAFSVPAVNAGSRSILAFRMNPDPSGSVTLTMTLNGTSVMTQAFDTEPQRVWHEVVEANILKPTGNILTITKSGSGFVGVSDVYLMYQANI